MERKAGRDVATQDSPTTGQEHVLTLPLCQAHLLEKDQLLGGPEDRPTLKQRHVDTERQCPTGKLPFLTASGARQMLKTFKTRRDEWREKERHLVVYRCRHCQRHHIGNAANFQSGWEGAERQRRPRNLPNKRNRSKHFGRRRKDQD